MAAEDRDILAYDPWGAEETEVRTLSDKMVVVRKEHECAMCFGPIEVGARVRALTEANLEDRVVMTFRFCPLCCEAMAADDDGKSIDARTAVGAINSASRPAS